MVGNTHLIVAITTVPVVLPWKFMRKLLEDKLAILARNNLLGDCEVANLGGNLLKPLQCGLSIQQVIRIVVKTSFCGEWNLEFGSNTTEKFEISRGEAE